MRDRSATPPGNGRRRARRLGAYLGIASLAAAAMVADAGFGPVRADAQPAAPARGPVGWDTYRNLGATAQLRGDEKSFQASSFDRTGGNNDGFRGTYSCLRITDRGCVIAEHDGAGEITSIWSTREPWGDVTATGNIMIELDGRVILNAPLVDVVNGRVGAPFAWPLVAGAGDAAGGVSIKVPMPYRNSMRVTVQHNPYFYHVSYRAFPNADGVQTFNPHDPAGDVLDRLRRFGVADPKPAASGATPTRKDFDLAPGSSTTIARLAGPQQISQLRVRLPQVVGSPQAVDDGYAFGQAGGSRFTMRVNPNNQGIRLIRRYDAQIADQVADVFVDGRPVGQWRGGPARPGQWGVEFLEVPAELTAGKSEVQVSSRFVSSSLDVNEFRYDVHSKVGGEWVRTDVLDLGPDHPGEQSAHGYRIDNEVFARSKLIARYPNDPGQVAASDEVLSTARIRITFDGQTTVDAPIGEFFGTGLGEYDVRSLMTSVDPGLDGWYTSWWPMPFAQNAVVEVVNGGGIPITGATAEVISAPAEVGGNTGYFHATHLRGNTVPGRDWTFLNTSGAGTFYGVTHTMRGLIPPGAAVRSDQPHSLGTSAAVNQRNYLEGDERFYVDGSAEPAWHGTGTEDFYESGWYFRDGTTFSMPQVGNPSHEIGADGCQFDCTGAYRIMVNDAVPFRTGLRAGIEHGPVNDEPGDYSSTTYWYGGRVSGRQLPIAPPAPARPPETPPAAPSAPPETSTPPSSTAPPEPGTPEEGTPETTGQDDGERPADVQQVVDEAIRQHQRNG
ncbi:glycoside hydrolase family 172 protein [Saccharopolyspora sp. NPDC003752]